MPGTTLTHRLFLVSILGKGALGAVQLATAAMIWAGLLAKLPPLVQWIMRAELAEDPNDFLAARLISFAGQAVQTDQSFYAIYFFAHGALHVGVVAALLYGALWAYPAAIAVLAVFVLYQMAEWLNVGGTMLIVLTAIDVAVIGLTLIEWKHKKTATGPSVLLATFSEAP
jgi:uncharacterized membrane protein